MGGKALPMVYRMKRLFRLLMGVTSGISVHHLESTGRHFVQIDFDNSADASQFYQTLSSFDPLKIPEYASTIYGTTTSTGSAR